MRAETEEPKDELGVREVGAAVDDREPPEPEAEADAVAEVKEESALGRLLSRGMVLSSLAQVSDTSGTSSSADMTDSAWEKEGAGMAEGEFRAVATERCPTRRRRGILASMVPSVVEESSASAMLARLASSG